MLKITVLLCLFTVLNFCQTEVENTAIHDSIDTNSTNLNSTYIHMNNTNMNYTNMNYTNMNITNRNDTKVNQTTVLKKLENMDYEKCIKTIKKGCRKMFSKLKKQIKVISKKNSIIKNKIKEKVHHMIDTIDDQTSSSNKLSNHFTYFKKFLF